jgi:initiation factor 1A
MYLAWFVIFIFRVMHFQVIRMLGNGRLEAQCFDDVKRLCHIRGKMRKRTWVNQGDIVLVGLREYQDGKGDVILVSDWFFLKKKLFLV